MADIVVSIFISGLVLGSLYALMASGLSMVWTTLGIFNFAHGVSMTVGAYVAYEVSRRLGADLWIGYSIVVALIVMVVVGSAFEYLLIRPFYGRDDMVLVTIMTTLAGLTFMENGVLAIWGPRLKQLAPLVPGNVSYGLIRISWQEVVIVLIAPIILFALIMMLNHTQVGRAIRAVGQNQKSAHLIGIPVKRMFLVSFGTAAALAGLAGMLLAGVRLMTPTMGSEPLMKALIVVIFGGLGSVGGSIGAAYVIGFLEAILVFTIGIYWTPSALFLVMVLVLLFRPQGLFGARNVSAL
jgi:branched-chain amino acid transport system permease protein